MKAPQPSPGRVHELKTWPVFFDAIRAGRKAFEIRRNDRGYEVGDVLRLREWDTEAGGYTGRELRRTITYVIQGEFGLPADVCVMSLAEPESGERGTANGHE